MEYDPRKPAYRIFPLVAAFMWGVTVAILIMFASWMVFHG